jgi:inner membrane protein
MPFDGTWFYGDTLFIIDPWFWLMTAAGLVLARSSSRRAIIGWAILALLASALVFLVPFVPIGVKLVWAVGVVGIVGLRRTKSRDIVPSKVARLGLTSLIIYVGCLYGLARVSEMSAAEGSQPLEVQASPMPGVPWEHRVVLVFDDHYRVVPPHDDPFDVPRKEPNKAVLAAMKAEQVQGFMNWTRFPYWAVEESDAGFVVTFRDLRYVDPGEPARGIGLAEVHLDGDLNVVD